MNQPDLKFGVEVRAALFNDATRWCWETCGGANREMPAGSPGQHWMALPIPQLIDLNQGPSAFNHMFYFEDEQTAFEAKIRFG